MKPNTIKVIQSLISRGYNIDTINGKVYNPQGKEIGSKCSSDYRIGAMIEGKVFNVIRRQVIWVYANGPYDASKHNLCYKAKNIENIDRLDNIELVPISVLKAEQGKASSIERRHNAAFSKEQIFALRNEYREKPFSVKKRSKELGISHITLAKALKGFFYAKFNEECPPVKLFLGPIACKPKERKTNLDALERANTRRLEREAAKAKKLEEQHNNILALKRTKVEAKVHNIKLMDNHRKMVRDKVLRKLTTENTVVVNKRQEAVAKKPIFDIKAMAAKIMAKRTAS